MNINTVLLTEGIKFFKYSSRIKSYVEKAKKKEIKDEGLKKIISDLSLLQKKFSKLEKAYDKIDTPEEKKITKTKWKILEAENEKLIALIRKEEMKKTAIGFGIFALLLTVLMLIKNGIEHNVEKLEDDKSSLKIEHKKPITNGVDKIPEQVHNPDLAPAVESFKGIIIPDDDYSRADLVKILKDECTKQKFPYEIAKEVVTAESQWNHKAISYDKSSVGLMQLNVSFKDDFATKYFSGDKEKFNPFDPKMNAEAGVKYLKHLIKLNHGDLREALLDYNAGSNRATTTKGTMRYADQIIIRLGKNAVTGITK